MLEHAIILVMVNVKMLVQIVVDLDVQMNVQKNVLQLVEKHVLIIVEKLVLQHVEIAAHLNVINHVLENVILDALDVLIAVLVLA